MSSLRETVAGTTPRLRALLERPGANELLADLQWGLLQRFAARGIKFVMGAQQAVQQAQQGQQQQAQQAPSPAVVQAQVQAQRDGLGPGATETLPAMGLGR